MKKVSMIIVNYNTRDLLEKCINNLLNGYENIEIMVVDNGSKDGSAKMVKEKFSNEPKVNLIATENNGLSAGYNLGLEKSTGDYLLYLGTDAFPGADSIEKLIKFMERSDLYGVCTAKLVLRDGSLDMDAHRGLMTPWSSLMHWFYFDRLFPTSPTFNGYNLGYKDFTEPHEIDACISHFMLVKREVQEKVGKWDEDFFLYGEDIDFCYRVQKIGYKIMYVSNVTVLHYKGATVGRKSTKDLQNKVKTSAIVKKIKATGRTQSMKLFYKKHMEEKYPAPLNWLVYTGIFGLEKLRTLQVYLKG